MSSSQLLSGWFYISETTWLTLSTVALNKDLFPKQAPEVAAGMKDW